jgi:hypothetical protein
VDWVDFGNMYLDQPSVNEQSIAANQVQRSILASCYSQLLHRCEIAAIECYPEVYADLEAVADQYAGHLDQKGKVQFMKAIYALIQLGQKRMDAKKTAEQKS